MPFFHARGQWLPPAVEVQDPNTGGYLVLVNTSGILYGTPAANGASANYSATDSSNDTWNLSFYWNGSQYTYSYNDSWGSSGGGTYDANAYAFTASYGSSVGGVDVDGSPWPPSSIFGPPAVLVNGALWTSAGAYADSDGNTYDAYGDQSGDVLLLTPSEFSIVGGSADGASGIYCNGAFVALNTTADVRSVDSSGNLLVPSYGPTNGPPAVAVNGSLWHFVGTSSSYASELFGTGYSINSNFDVYLGQNGQYLLVSGDQFFFYDWNTWNLEQNAYDGLFYSVDQVICPTNSDGSIGSPAIGYSSLWVNGSQWNFVSDVNGSDIYAGSVGQFIMVTANNVVLVNDPYTVGMVSGYYNWGSFSVEGESILTSNPNAVAYQHSSPPYYSPFWVNGVTYTWSNGYTDNAGNYYDYYVGSDGSSLAYINGQFSPPISGEIELSNPDHSQSAFGYTQVWYGSKQYTWTWGYDDSQGNSYDYYVDSNGDQLIDLNNSFASQGVQTTAPPTSPINGPPALWVNARIFQWSYSSMGPNTNGVDTYVDGLGDTIQLVDNMSLQDIAVAVTMTSNFALSTSGYYDATTQLFDVSGLDIRAADANDNVIYQVAPQGLPPAIRVDTPMPLWKFLGSTSGMTSWSANMTTPVYAYAGSQPGQWLIIDSSTPSAQVVVNDPNNSGNTTGAYFGGAFWTDSRDLRAENLNGSPVAPPSLPTQGPGSIWQGGVLYSYMGSWNGQSNWGSTSPQPGDYFVGPNAGQRFVLLGNEATLWINGAAVNGTYANGLFSFPGYSVFAGDSSGDVLTPVVGPPAVWVDGIIFSFMPSSRDPLINQDTYGDGSGNTVVVTSTTVAGKNASNQTLWSGSYTPNADPTQPGIFQISSTGSTWYDVRPYNQTSPLQNGGQPQSGHPQMVKVNGLNWSFQGQTSSNDTTLDYYYGAQDGQCLVVDSNNNFEVWTSTASFTPDGTGFLIGTVFIVTGADVRALSILGAPASPSGSPTWGPPNVWVDGLTYLWLGTATGDSRGINADYYGGPNVGQIVSVDSSSNVIAQNPSSGVPSVTGSYHGGVFVAPGADIRGLTAGGAFQAPTTTPLYGDPTQLRVGGLPWNYLGSANGQNYYASNQSGQRLSVDSNGNIQYSDWPDGVTAATGTYSNGIFTAGTGGTSYNAGTISGDLDILGNLLSLGAWSNDPNTAGLTISYVDSNVGSGQYAATVGFNSSRPSSTWVWSSGEGSSSTNAVSVMALDASHRLSLFNSSSPGQAGVILNPNGQSYFKSPLHIEPQGDLNMGEFTQQPSQ